MAKAKLNGSIKKSKRSSPVEERSESSLVTIHIDDLSDEAMEELLGFSSIAMNFETGCTDPAHITLGGWCTQGCALDPKSFYGRLQQVQLCGPDKKVHIVRISSKDWLCTKAHNLIKVITQVSLKIVHYTAFEIGWYLRHLTTKLTGMWICTKTASQIAFPQNKQSLNNLVQDHLGKEILKDDDLWKWGWAQKELSARQIEYSINDVIYLHDLHRILLSKMNPDQIEAWYVWCDEQKRLCALEYSTGVDRKVLGRM